MTDQQNDVELSELSLTMITSKEGRKTCSANDGKINGIWDEIGSSLYVSMNDGA